MYYAVKIGKKPGIYDSWAEASKYVLGFPGAKYKSFKTQQDAQLWLNDISSPNQANTLLQNPYPEEQTHDKLEMSKPNIIQYDYSYADIYNVIDAIIKKSNKLQTNVWFKYGNIFYIFTDGSHKALTNKSGTGIYIGEFGISIKLADGYTNNQAELLGILYVLHQISLNMSDLKKMKMKIVIVTDSIYCVNSITKWMKDWAKNNWKKADGSKVLNYELMYTIYELWNAINVVLKGYIKLKHQFSHKTAPKNEKSMDYMLWYGNKMADYFATLSA